MVFLSCSTPDVPPACLVASNRPPQPTSQSRLHRAPSLAPPALDSLAPFFPGGLCPTGSACSSSTAPWSSSCTDCTSSASWPVAPRGSWRPSATPGTSSPLRGCTSGVSGQGARVGAAGRWQYQHAPGVLPPAETSDPSLLVSKEHARLKVLPSVPLPHAASFISDHPRSPSPQLGLGTGPLARSPLVPSRLTQHPLHLPSRALTPGFPHLNLPITSHPTANNFFL